jgi:deazaflavin-dependent oxidoreductase (nitroreductase family)
MVTSTQLTHTIRLGPRTQHVVRIAARFLNPLVVLIAGRRWMPILGILHHRGRRSGRAYATPLGMRHWGNYFVMPRTFGEDAAWYRNVLAAGGCSVKYLGNLLPCRARGDRLPSRRAGIPRL